MQFIVESGVGMNDATSYVSVEYADQYISFFYPDSEWQELDEDEKELRLINATDYIDNFLVWTSTIKNENQALNWPRDEFKDRQGRLIGDDSVPKLVKEAVAVVAHISINHNIFDEGVLLRSEMYGNSQDTYAVPTRVGNSADIDNVRKKFLRAGYGRSATSIIELERA